MNLLRRHLRPALWLALAALAAMALLPTLSHAMARAAGGAGSGFTEVCTPQGMKLVALGDGETAPDSAALQLEHCPWCTAALADLAPPPVRQRADLPPACTLLLPPLNLHGPRTLHAWLLASPRAPPVLA
ncbi:DUF2946 family protein [Rubrivivax sp. RP6-9]|uniref:DUF2946 family protein n=1 Tax=Rubrivivax sp. RP6-9 TaxID=3415750 RepID=UPI003CC53204